MTTGLFCKTENHAEAEPGTTRGLFCGEKRLEGMPDGLRSHARAIICDIQF